MALTKLQFLVGMGFLYKIFDAGIPTSFGFPVSPHAESLQEAILEEWFLNSMINPFMSEIDELATFFSPLDPSINLENDVTFQLYTRDNPDNAYILKVGDPKNVKASPLKPDNKIKVIIHGWTDSSTVHWLSTFRNNYLAIEDCNVIIVDWFPIAKKEYYLAVKLTNQVGEYVGELLEFLKSEGNISLSDVHISGHSLGAHIAGFAGSFLSGKIGRITGMDPARPAFEIPFLKDQKGRLDPSDAAFVDVIHTCAGSVGFVRAIGHVDFYPNGGTFKQPGCSALVSQYCSHGRSHQFMAESIIYPEEFVAVKCDDWAEFKAGKCMNESTSFMGENVRSDIRGLYFLETDDGPPFGKGSKQSAVF